MFWVVGRVCVIGIGTWGGSFGISNSGLFV